MVSWYDTKDFIKVLENMESIQEFKQQEGLENYSFRLANEAEWEYAARGGNYSQSYKYLDFRQKKRR